MTKEEKYWEERGFNDACWGYPLLDHAWDKYPKKYQKSYRLGQWRAYDEGKSFNNKAPWFARPE